MFHHLVKIIIDSENCFQDLETESTHQNKPLTTKDVNEMEKTLFDMGSEIRYSHMFLSIL